MKLYSRERVFLLSLVLILITSFSFFFIGANWKSKKILEEQNQTAKTESARNFCETVYSSSNFTEAASNQDYTKDEEQNISVYEDTNEAVVNITTETMGVDWFLDPVPMEGASGSGSIIDESGLVLTNTHVIADASKIYVSLFDGSQYEASVVGVDPENDLAVLRFTPAGKIKLKTIKFGSSSGLKVGQKVLAIGNPFGLERTLTVGIVSALSRPIQSKKNIIIKNMIQTDTAINPGNSGGPLLNSSGKMIGINTMIFSTSGSSAGVGFAVPIDTAKRVVAEILKYGKVRRGSIDAELIQISSNLVRYAQLPVDRGLLVSQVKRGSYAADAGLKGGTEAVRSGFGRYSSLFYIGGDIIVEIAGHKITNLTDYYSALEDKKPDETISVKVIRGKKELSLNIKLAERN